MQGVTRDNAIASNLWRPKPKVRRPVDVPERDDPGAIQAERSRERDHGDRPSGNPSKLPVRLD